MGGRPSMPADVIQLNGASHRTNAEYEQRRKAEAALLTGVPMKIWAEVKKNKIAAEEFERVRELLAYIGKDDALHEGVVNRYSLLRSECVAFEKKRETFNRSIAELKKEYKNQPVCIDKETGKRLFDFSPSTYYKLVDSMQKNVINLDKQVQSKRNMMLAIEKENLMTIASALRSIPKKVEKQKKSGGMADYLAKRTGG